MRPSPLAILIVVGLAIIGSQPGSANTTTAPGVAKPISVAAPNVTPTPAPTLIPLDAQTSIQIAQFQTGCAGTGLSTAACLSSLSDGKLIVVAGFNSGGINAMPKRYGLFKTSRTAGTTVPSATHGWGGDTLIASGTLDPTLVIGLTGSYMLPGFRQILPVADHECLTVRWFADDVSADAMQTTPSAPICRTWTGLPTTTTTYITHSGDFSSVFSSSSIQGARFQTPPCNVVPNALGGIYLRPFTVGTDYAPAAACPAGTAWVQWSTGLAFAGVHADQGILKMRVISEHPIPCAGALFVTIAGGKRKQFAIDGAKKLDAVVDVNDGLWPSGFTTAVDDVQVELFPPESLAKCLSAFDPTVDGRLEVTTLNNITVV